MHFQFVVCSMDLKEISTTFTPTISQIAIAVIMTSDVTALSDINESMDNICSVVRTDLHN